MLDVVTPALGVEPVAVPVPDAVVPLPVVEPVGVVVVPVGVPVPVVVPVPPVVGVGAGAAAARRACLTACPRLIPPLIDV